ncbi:50S ribosomal protein L30 [Desulfovermiculus halophilus]|uniref:50S ribosomal protein L30 n=1 Tax=Desulfovermiculus halophilus TaxID=339722 RepID=UPI000488DE34|nr:50S ribosomal protein L30 [Desulfovermiculus halophilus]
MMKVKLIRSRIGSSPKQRRNLDALGLRKLHQEREVQDSPVSRGMIRKVKHMVEVTDS